MEPAFLPIAVVRALRPAVQSPIQVPPPAEEPVIDGNPGDAYWRSVTGLSTERSVVAKNAAAGAAGFTRGKTESQEGVLILCNNLTAENFSGRPARLA
jgi:hypothetical protein